MSNNRIVVGAGVAAFVAWLWFTCKGREVLNGIMRRLGRPEVKPCCTGCADHVGAPTANGPAPLGSGVPVMPAPSPTGYSGNYATGAGPAMAIAPTVSGYELQPPPEPPSYAPAASSYAPPSLPPPPTGIARDESVSSFTPCEEPACRPYVAPTTLEPVYPVDVKTVRTPAPVDESTKPPSAYVNTYDGVSGTVGPLTSLLTTLREAAPSFLKPVLELAPEQTATFYAPPAAPEQTATFYTPITVSKLANTEVR